MPRTSHVTTKKSTQDFGMIDANAGKHWRKMKRLDQPSKSRHTGCPGCEHCNNSVRNAARAAGFADEWGQADEIECDFDESINYPDDIWEIDDPYELYPFYWADTRYFETEDCWRLYYREGGRWGWNYLPPTARELAMDLASLDELNDTFIPTYPKEMVNTTTNKSTRRPQARKDKRITRDRAAKKRAMHLARKAEAEALYAPTSVDSPRTIIKGWDTWDKAIETDKAARRQARIDAFLLAEGRADIEPEMTFEVIDEPFEDENLCICYGLCAYSDWAVHPSYDDVHQLALDEIENDMHYDDFVKCVQEDDEDTDPNPVYDFGGYLKYNGVFLLKEGMGYGLDGVFGDAGANCGFSVTRRP